MFEELRHDPLNDQIRAIQEGQGDEFWSFKNATRRSGAHALIHYPAMMVPTLQGKLLEAIHLANPRIKEVLDPFVGSGTILVESMTRKLNFTGIDINPLAALACLAKSGPYFVSAFNKRSQVLLSRIQEDKNRKHYTLFEGRKKWFSDPVALALDKISRCIEQEPERWARRLYWLALAKVVRTSCNSRMSTYKLHIKKEGMGLNVDPISLFKNVIKVFAVHIDYQHKTWKAQGLLYAGRYTGDVEIKLGDTRKLLNNTKLHNKFDVIMTSPPYGDNATTIPYGQFSYLPMQWIKNDDISNDLAPHLLSNTHAIDTASLGGSLRNAIERGADLGNKYDAAKKFLKNMKCESSEFKRFAGFFADLDSCLDQVCAVTKTQGYQTWTIGNRHMGGNRVPMEDILSEMLVTRGVNTIARIQRSIHSKKMANRNNVAPTMCVETILLARKTIVSATTTEDSYSSVNTP